MKKLTLYERAEIKMALKERMTYYKQAIVERGKLYHSNSFIPQLDWYKAICMYASNYKDAYTALQKVSE